MWTDELGRDWSTAINVNTVRRVKDMTGVLLTDAADTDLVQQLYDDVMLLCDVLYAICKPQAEQRDIDGAAFGELLAGEVIDKARDSFMMDLAAFFPSGRRQGVEKILTAAKKIDAERLRLLTEKMTEEQINHLIAETAKRTSEEIDRRLAQLGDASGKSLESSESTPES